MLKAIIFDLDGVISDTQKIHTRVEREIFARMGFDMSETELTEKYAGVPDTIFFQKIFSDQKRPKLFSIALKAKWDRLMCLKKSDIKPIPGAKALIDQAIQKKFKIAVASSSPRQFVKLILKRLNLLGKLKFIFAIEDVRHGKPAPDVYLLAAKKLNVKPEECLVIEDSINGMLAAKRAGMTCIGLVEDKNNQKYPADILVESLSEIKIEKLK